jgi:hypothetical protein
MAERARKSANLVPGWPEIQLLAAAATMRSLNFSLAIEYYEKSKQIYGQRGREGDKENIATIDKLIGSIREIDLNEFVNNELKAAEERLLRQMRIEDRVASGGRRPKADAKMILDALRKSEAPLAEGGKMSENVVNVKQAEALLRDSQRN